MHLPAKKGKVSENNKGVKPMKRFISGLVLSGIAFSTSALSLNNPPKCPSAALLEQVQFTHASKDANPHLWVAWDKARYSTEQEWLVTATVDNVTNEDEALQEVNSSAKELNLLAEEAEETSPNTWLCMYMNVQNFSIWSAITPAPSLGYAVNQLKAHSHHK